MVLHIVGAGPSGVTIAWYMATQKGEEVHLWEKRDLPGGSWWTPDHTESADRHAARVLFRDSQPNWFTLLQEMDLDYNTYYKPEKEVITESIKAMARSLTLRDHLVTAGVLISAGANQEWSKTTTLHTALKGKMSAGGLSFINALATSVDGVAADRMTVWELAESINRTFLSGAWSERVQGRKLGEDLDRRLRAVGVRMHMNTGLLNIDPPHLMFEGDHTVQLHQGTDKVVLCLDPSAALPYVEKFWAMRVDDVIYGTRSFLLKYPKRFELPAAQESLMRSNNSFIPSWVPGEGTTTLHVADYNGGWRSMEHLVETLGIPPPMSWRECEDTQDMSSAVWTARPIPTRSKHPQVHMVGMLSPRDTPYASVEAASEVALRWCGERPLKPFKTSTLALIAFIISLLTVV